MTANSKNPTLKAWLDQAIAQLTDTKIGSAHLDSELIAGFVLEKSRTWVHAHPEYQLTERQHAAMNDMLKSRTDHVPLAYILEQKEFFGRDFIITKDVLVPRPESEDFIELITSISVKNLSFVDVGTGSGILAVTIAREHPTWSGTATDISAKALKVAQKNAQKLDAKNLVFKRQNLLANDFQNYDIVIANLPYVPQNVRGQADIAHEPDIALFADHDGLALYKELFQQLTELTQKPTHIFTESLLNQHAGIEQLAEAAGYRLKETKGLIQHFLFGQ